jgi:hypothetical protein
MYQRDARFMSYQCGDAYCIQKVMLFACVPKAAASVDTTPSSAAQGNTGAAGAQVYCTFPGARNPHLAKVELTAAACSRGGGTILGPVT